MITGTSSTQLLISDLVAQRKPGYALPRPFYHQPDLYPIEMQSIWRQGWLFAGLTSQIPLPGDYFVYEIDSDSILIVRQDDGSIGAFHNVCRHRGSLIVTEPVGHARSFICPYHQWTYGRNGRLLHCRHMPSTINKSSLGLHPVHVQNLEGLIYISLAAQPPDFTPARDLMGSMSRPQGFEWSRIAHIIDYDIPANWKLVWENNRECYHCDVNHPEYIQANFDRYDADHLNVDVSHRLAELTARNEAKWAACGFSATHTAAGLFAFPDAEHHIWYSANRTVLETGYVTESLDGKRVGPLMGDYAAEEVGTLRLRTLPNFWSHASCDHAVVTRLTPAGPRLTKARVIWLVNETAVLDRDYTLETLLPFWQLTSEQDWLICERQQRGVDSSAYTPGPLSPTKEYNVDSFIRWYVQQLERAIDPNFYHLLNKR